MANARDVFIDLFSSKKKSKVKFTVDGVKLNAVFKMGNNALTIAPLDKTISKKCIEVLFDEDDDDLYLSSYYYLAGKDKCPPIPDTLFFKWLDAVSSTLDKEVVLMDSSTKQLKDHPNCKISHFILALAKGKTFYNRFGFTNDLFQEFLEEFQPKKLAEFDSALNKKFSDITKVENATLQQVAKFILDNCDNPENETRKFIADFIRKIEVHLYGDDDDDEAEENTDMDHFYKSPEHAYRVRISQAHERPSQFKIYFNTISSANQTAGRRRRRRKTRVKRRF